MPMVGVPNLNYLPITFKMTITNKVTGKSFKVMYNPQSYSISRGVNYSEKTGLDANMPSIQFVSGNNETLEFDLFFDTFSASVDAGGSMADLAKLTANSILPSVGKYMDVRDFTKKVYNLMVIDGSSHVPPLVKIEWNSLQFEGHLVNCTQQFTKFNERGMPVRATLHCVFKRYMKPSDIAKMNPNESPDTAKFRKVTQGDSLWSFAAKEYGQSDQWREIASANEIVNPRIMDTGSTLRIPAL